MIPRLFPLVLLPTLLLTLAVGGGCVNNGAHANNGLPLPTLSEASAAFERHDYARAYSMASTLASFQGGASDQAAYIAGLSAKQLGKPAEAERYLLEAARSGDARTAGNAGASLGLLYAELGRYGLSSDALLRAAPKLTGEDQAKAYFYAAVAQQKLGRQAQARTNLLLARQRTGDADLKRQIDQQLLVIGYTVQVGAFHDHGNAEQSARQLASTPTAKALGDPRLVTAKDDDGKAMYLVQIGRFATFEAANQVRQQIGRNTAIVVPLTPSGR